MDLSDDAPLVVAPLDDRPKPAKPRAQDNCEHQKGWKSESEPATLRLWHEIGRHVKVSGLEEWPTSRPVVTAIGLA